MSLVAQKVDLLNRYVSIPFVTLWQFRCQYSTRRVGLLGKTLHPSWCVLREVRAIHPAHIPRFLCFVWQRVSIRYTLRKVLCLHELGDRQCMSSSSQIVHRSTKVFLRCKLHQASPSLYLCQISQRGFGILIAFGDPETQVDTDSEEIYQNKRSLGSARCHLNLLKVSWSIWFLMLHEDWLSLSNAEYICYHAGSHHCSLSSLWDLHQSLH